MLQFSGRALKDLRRAAGLRPEQLAVAVDRSVDSIRSYESGRVQPSVPTLLGLADALNSPVDALLAESEVDHADVA